LKTLQRVQLEKEGKFLVCVHTALYSSEANKNGREAPCNSLYRILITNHTLSEFFS